MVVLILFILLNDNMNFSIPGCRSLLYSGAAFIKKMTYDFALHQITTFPGLGLADKFDFSFSGVVFHFFTDAEEVAAGSLNVADADHFVHLTRGIITVGFFFVINGHLIAGYGGIALSGVNFSDKDDGVFLFRG